MKAEILKGGGWRELFWGPMQGPIVTKEIELDELFSFVAPRASLTIYDHEGRFRPGGMWAIERGDVIRIMAGTGNIYGYGVQNSIEIFSGFVAMGVEWDERSGTVRFNAFGWLAALSDIYLGKPGYGVGMKWIEKHRWIKTVTDDEGNTWEWVAWEYAYDRLSPSKKLGYRKVYLYDTRGDPFEMEYPSSYLNSTIWEKVEAGIFRRKETVGILVNVNTGDVAANVVEQINLDSPGHELVFEPGEVRGDMTVRVIDEAFARGDVFATVVHDRLQTFFLGWEVSESGYGKLNPNEPDIVDWNVRLFDIINNSMAAEKVKLEFDEHGKHYLWGSEPLKEGELWDDFNLLKNIVQVRGRISDKKVVIYRLWSWLKRDWIPEDPPDNPHEPREYPIKNIGVVITRYARGEWFVVELNSGGILNHHTIFDRGDHVWRYDIGDEFNLPELYRSIDVSDDGRWGEFSTEPAVNEGAENLDVDEMHYYMDDGVLFISGNLALDSLAFEFRDVKAPEVLKEICKLTNSILMVEAEGEIKTIYLVARDYMRDEHDLPDVLLPGPLKRRHDYFGERTLELRSEIIQNESHIDMLNRFYGDEYLDEKDDRWTLRFPEVDAVCRVKRLDGIRLPSITGRRAAIVRKIEYRVGEVTITMTRGDTMERGIRGA